MARGYLNQAELTAERFRPDPFRPGGRLYLTGDLARRSASRDLHFLGRLDHQDKIRGFRVELGEVQATLGRHPAVAVVLAHGEAADRRLVALFTTRAGAAEPADPSLLRALAARAASRAHSPGRAGAAAGAAAHLWGQEIPTPLPMTPDYIGPAMACPPTTGSDLDGYVIVLEALGQLPIDPGAEFRLLFQGGFGPEAHDKSKESTCLVLAYPGDVAQLPSIDFRPTERVVVAEPP